MNPQMRLVIMLAVLWAGGSILFAAEPTTPRGPLPAGSESKSSPDGEQAEQAEEKSQDKAQTEQAAGEKADEKDAPDAIAGQDKEPESQRAPAKADRAGSPQRFTPSEQVRADFDVSFPIDI